MKKFLSIALGTLISVAAIAANPTLSVTATAKTNVFNIYYKSAEKGNVIITIYNDQNTVVFKEVIYAVTSFVRPYNFDSAKDGQYTIVIEDKNGKRTETINCQHPKMTNFINVAQVPNQENKYWFFAANGGSDVMSLRIVAADGVVLHEQTIEVAGSFTKVYDLNKVKNHTGVTFEIVDGNGKLYQTKF